MKNILIIFALFLSGCVNQNNDQPISRIGNLSDQVVILVPTANATISSPLQVKGQAPGNWFFEATAPLVVVDWDGKIIGEHYITAQGDWMTTDLVPFSGEVSFEIPEDIPYRNGALILQRHNASGLPKHDAAVEIPIQFSK
ncbi:Gmad2 immunoglobulin-like domain-containing protein [Candidatus Gracilibacteria bacterium]|nr:Gmad2 immunoglobulin-like domain-containing protein [Candidatus Gracilibacteria bacterium]